MSAICLSYSRQSKEIVRTLADDIEALGHTVWFDQELTGGQAWWDQILERVRDCEVFVFALAPEALNSTACKREYQYAADLGKPILPVLVAEGVSINLLPPALSAIQFVDYQEQDRNAAFRLAKAIYTIPPPGPLPDPLPVPPEVPISYLGGLAEQVRTTSTTLGFEEQSALVVKLKRSLSEPESTADALLESLRKRRDLFADMRDEIDEPLSGTKRTASPSPSVPDSEAPTRHKSQRQKKRKASKPSAAVPEPEADPESIVTDPETGLMWTRDDNGKDIDWDGANEYAKNLRLGGYTDWRLPTIDELEKLYDREKGSIRDPFVLTRDWCWSSTKEGSGSAWYFYFVSGIRVHVHLAISHSKRALCVRRPEE